MSGPSPGRGKLIDIGKLVTGQGSKAILVARLTRGYPSCGGLNAGMGAGTQGAVAVGPLGFGVSAVKLTGQPP